MNERLYTGDIDKLRRPERIKRMQPELILKLALEDIKVTNMLDVGTGSGLFAQLFYEQGINATGLDINPDMIKAARQYLPQCNFVHSPAEKMDFPENSFDLVFFGLIFHELDDYLEALTRARKIANKRVCILEWPYKDQPIGPPLEHRLKPDFILQLSRQAGFTQTDISEMSNLVLYRLQKSYT